MVRWMCGATLKDRILSAVLYSRLQVESASEVVSQGRLRWFGHVERKETSDWVSACRVMDVEGDRGRCRGRKTWAECVRDDLGSFGLKKEWAQDRTIWRSLIRGNRPTRASMENVDVK